MSDVVEPVTPVLEPAAQAFAEATARPPFLFDLPPAEGARPSTRFSRVRSTRRRWTRSG